MKFNKFVSLAVFCSIFSVEALMASTLKFCVATSAHQIEGNNFHSDWWHWEAKGNVKNREISGIAADHWNRVDQDINLMKYLGVDTYRFSVEWAKLEPRQGQWDPSVLDHYRREIKKLRAAGIEPFITLNHFTLPQWVAEKGGWEWPGIVAAFRLYAEKVSGFVSEGVRDWVTLNEPMVVAANGYVLGLFPPQKSNDLKAISVVIKHMLQAHAVGYKVLHKQAALKNLPVRVGIAHHLKIFDPHRKLNPTDWFLASTLDRLFNWTFFNATRTGIYELNFPGVLKVREEIQGLKDTEDFIGVNYYSRDFIGFANKPPLFMMHFQKPGLPRSDLGWEIYPAGLERILSKLRKQAPNIPILITENGIADRTDGLRLKFLREHVAVVEKARKNGAKVETYCHWSLIDNFEWAEGFAPRFGLFEVDYATQNRIPRTSARTFRELTGKFLRN